MADTGEWIVAQLAQSAGKKKSAARQIAETFSAATLDSLIKESSLVDQEADDSGE